jgi:uncharacterized protein YceK
MTNTQQQNSAPVPGQYFGFPGQTVPLFAPDTAANGLAFSINPTSPQVIAGVQAMQKTDVITSWLVDLDLTESVTVGTGGTAPTVSPNSIYHALQSIVLSAGTGFDLINVSTGTDLDAINRMHPSHRSRNYHNDTRASNSNYTSVLAGQASTTASGTNGKIYLDLPASMIFDSYLPIAPNGSPQSSVAFKAIVSPQFMSGARVLQAQLTVAGVVGANGETANLYGSTTDLTISGAGTLTLYRRGYYGSNEVFLPLIQPWQRQIKSQIIPIGASTTGQIPLPQVGQIGGIVVRLVDPASSNSLGPSFTQANLSISSGFSLSNTTDIDVLSWVNFVNQKELNGAGTNQIQFDLWTDEWGQVTNRYSINTISTTNAVVNYQLASAGSASTYAVLTYDALVPQTVAPLN